MIKATLLARGAGLTAVILALFLILSYMMFPTGRIDSLLAQVLSRQGLSLSPPVHKTLLPGLAWDDLLLSSEQGPLLS